MEESVVGSLINFRGLVYSPINEQGVVFLFGRILDDLNMYIEEVRVKYPDCVARRYTGKGWERVYIEFEFKSSNFITHGHDPNECNIIVCWIDDLSKEGKKQLEGIEIIALKDIIDTLEIPNRKIKEPSKTMDKSKYDLQHFYKKDKVNKPVQKLYEKLDTTIKSINDEVFRKFSRTAISYYSPEKMFTYINFTQSTIRIILYTNRNKLNGVTNIPNHENWGRIYIRNEKDLQTATESLQKSFSIIKLAIMSNTNTGWFALSKQDEDTDDDMETFEKKLDTAFSLN
jgi:hypothetical protein